MAVDHTSRNQTGTVVTDDLGDVWPDSNGFADAMGIDSNAAQFEPTKLFVHADRIRDWLRGELPAPVTLELDLTLVCNDRCPYCPHGFAHQGRCLDLDSIGRILDEAASLGIQGLTVTGGGEPLMHPKFRDVMRLIRTYPFAAGVITNGGRIDSEIASEMIATFQWIRVSLDAASEASFQRIRGRRGMAERLKRISLLAPARQEVYGSDCELGASFLTCSQTADEIVEAAQIAQDLGFDYIQFKPMVNWVGVNKHASPLMDQNGVFAEVESPLGSKATPLRCWYPAIDTRRKCAVYAVRTLHFIALGLSPRWVRTPLVPKSCRPYIWIAVRNMFHCGRSANSEAWRKYYVRLGGGTSSP